MPQFETDVSFLSKWLLFYRSIVEIHFCFKTSKPPKYNNEGFKLFIRKRFGGYPEKKFKKRNVNLRK